MRVNFVYTSNDLYKGVTGATTTNYHVFRMPSTTWNKVTSSTGHKYVFIFLAMRPISKTLTEWYVTSASNYLPMWIPEGIRRYCLERITRRIAQFEDRVQLESMVSDGIKTTHAGKILLPCDEVYDEWYNFVTSQAEFIG